MVCWSDPRIPLTCCLLHAQVALAEERRRRKEEKAIRIEAEEEMRRAQDQRDKLEFELSVIVDEIGLVHHAMED